MATRYTFTIAFAGASAFSPSLFDALTADTLRVLGATNVQPSFVVSSVSVPVSTRPDFGRSYLMPEAPNWYEPRMVVADDTGRREMSVNTPISTGLPATRLVLTKISRVFDANLPGWPWAPSLCAAAGLTTRECGRFTNARSGTSAALYAGIRDGLPGGYETLYPFPTGEAALAAPSGGYGGILVLLAVAGGYAYYATRSSPLRGLGRVPTSVKTSRLRKLAQRRRHEGRYMEARQLEQRANRLSRST